MVYCGQATAANANYLSRATGMDPAVALAWLKNECQSTPNPTNPLNIRYGNSTGQIGRVGGFGRYASTNAGLDSAAHLIMVSSHYAGIRAAIRSGNPAQQARAIELSPWAAGHYGGAKGPGGISRAWARLTGKPLPTGGDAPVSGELAGFAGLISFPTGHVITRQDIRNISATLDKNGWFKGNGVPGSGEIQKAAFEEFMFANAEGKAWTKSLQDTLAKQAGTDAKNIPGVPDIPGAIGSAVASIATIATYFVAVIFIVVGLWLYSKGTSQAEVPVGYG
jgi:hypothetical protein